MKNLSSAKSVGLVIPARFASTRLPGKPLIKILGKSMLQRTWERCCQAIDSSDVFIATDCLRIQSHVTDFGGQVVMTPDECLTGTDRVAEANKELLYDIVINVQGDEPCVDPCDIRKIKRAALCHPETVLNGFGVIEDENEYRSNTIPKAVMDSRSNLLYMSRSPIPGSKSSEFVFAHKQVCIYAFPQKSLNLFGCKKRKSINERIEDIEILRFLDNQHPVIMIELSGKNIAVDVEEDVKKVEAFLLDHYGD